MFELIIINTKSQELCQFHFLKHTLAMLFALDFEPEPFVLKNCITFLCSRELTHSFIMVVLHIVILISVLLNCAAAWLSDTARRLQIRRVGSIHGWSRSDLTSILGAC